MTRILALWLPNWPIQRLLRAKPELKQQSVILHRSSGRGQTVVACSHTAQQLGVRINMPLAEATAFACRKGSRCAPHSSFEDRKTLEKLAAWCHRFSPLVGIANDDPAETLLLDVTGIAPLFGGEPALHDQIVTALQQQSLNARVGLADTVGAAWALAHYATVLTSQEAFSECRDEEVGSLFRLNDSPLPKPDDQKRLPTLLPQSGKPASDLRYDDVNLQELSIAALRLPAEIIETLARLGLERIADLLPLSRDELKARFGAVLLQRLDQALGRQPELITPTHAPAEFTVESFSEHPVAQQSVVQQVIRQLLERLCFLLSEQGKGLLQLSCRLTCQNATIVTCEVGCFQPSADADHLWKLTELQLERLVVREPVSNISLAATSHAPLSQRQKELFDDDNARRDSPHVAALIDRMANRLGRTSIVGCVLLSDVQPEKAYRYEPLVGGRKPRRNNNRSPLSLLDRPLYLLAKPIALENCAVTANGSPDRFQYGGEQRIVSFRRGPERIETGWWRGRGVRRDYYRVETTQSIRFWIFHSLQEDRWFLQGVFA